MYEGDDLNYEDEETPPEESSNRTFLIAAGILGGIVLLSLCVVAGYWLFIRPQTAQQTNGQSAEATQNAQINEALTATGVAFDLSQTPQATATLVPTNTLVVAQPTATNTPEFTFTPDPATQTVAAGLTRVAASTATVISTTTALPTSGFADEFGLPGLVVAAMALVAVIFLARRLRASPTR
jgi:predicted ABC-type sugar transport system permease subunit